LQHLTHPRKEREDGAPSAEMMHVKIIEGGPPARWFCRASPPVKMGTSRLSPDSPPRILLSEI
jgi:hypothetical protein